MAQQSGQRYRADLAGHLAECEANFYRVIQLLPQLGDDDVADFGLPGDTVRLTVQERTPFTTTVVFQQGAALSPDLPAPRMLIRICHDACVAEVVRCQGAKVGKATFDYPNEHMMARDEKRQVNRFLGEWLSFCLRYGRSSMPAGDLLET